MLAVLISGSWRTGSALAEQNYKILTECGRPFKIFIHTWDENIATFRTPLETVYAHHWYFSLSEPVYEFVSPVVDLEILHKCYPGAVNKIESFNEDFFYDKYFFSNEQKAVPRYLNTCAMYYGMAQSRDLFLSDDACSDFKYFLKLRPDFLLSKAALDKVFSSSLVFIGQTIETDKGRVSDQCFGGEISKSFQAMNALDRLAPVLTGDGFAFPEDVAITGENPLIEHINQLRHLNDFEIEFFPQAPPFDMIQRPRVIGNPNRNLLVWTGILLRHNFAVLLNRTSGYSRILFSRISPLLARITKPFSR